MTMPTPPDPAPPEQATGPGWPGEDPDHDVLLDQSPTVTYQDGGLVAEPAPDPATTA